jgi:hypothetical protein
MQMLSLSDKQLRLVMDSASLIPVSQRDGFLRSIAGRLCDLPYQPSLADVEEAIRFVLACRGVAIGKDHFRRHATA